MTRPGDRRCRLPGSSPAGGQACHGVVALTGGSSDGILTNCASCDTKQPNLLNELDSAHISWRAYFEGLARHGVLTRRVLRALGPRGVFYLLWDEGPNSDLRGFGLQAGGGRIPLIAAGRLARRGGRVAVPANHYALLRTIAAPARPGKRARAPDFRAPAVRG